MCCAVVVTCCDVGDATCCRDDSKRWSRALRMCTIHVALLQLLLLVAMAIRLWVFVLRERRERRASLPTTFCPGCGQKG